MLEKFSFADLEFKEIPVTAYSSAGTPYTRRCRVGMPKIPEAILKSVIYLYRSKEDADAGKDFGGTGFLISIASENIPLKFHHYAVTNWHVACEDGASVIRINTRDGKTDNFEFDPAEWYFDGHHDIAVIPLDEQTLHSNNLSAATIAGEMFVKKDVIESQSIGAGEDIFMVGRFIDHDGKQKNKPAVRFGNISVMPTPILQSNGKEANSYIIDCHSRTGFSGSPVFVYRTPGNDLTKFVPRDTPFNQREVLLAGTHLLGLLGIHWAQFPEEWDLKDKKKQKIKQHSANIVDDKIIEGVSGMTCVLPAWKILEVLDMPKLKELRLKQDKEWEGDYAPVTPIPESAKSNDSNPSHKEDFRQLVTEAAKKQTQDH